MSAVKNRKPISVEDYLAGELRSSVKHEYVGGVVYAMAGAKNKHNRIAGNAYAAFHAKLRGHPCEPFNSDTKIRIRTTSITRFYYPDTSVICRPSPDDDSFQDAPAVIVEVLSNSTRRTDEGEKREIYQSIPSLNVYLLVEQDSPCVVAYRREENDFIREDYIGLDAVIPLPEIGIQLPLAEIYERVEFTPEPEEDEADHLR